MSVDTGEPTSPEEVLSVQTIEARLRVLLDKAHHLKQTTHIEPPLQPSDFEPSILSLSKSPADAAPDTNFNAILPTSKNPASHVALETAARNIFYPLIIDVRITSPEFTTVWNLLDLLQFCADHGQCDPSLPLRLVEELLDSQTINGCKHVFDYMESRQERLMSLPLQYASASGSMAGNRDEAGVTTSEAAAGVPVVAAVPTKKERDTQTRNKEMIVLRSCNELLRRLSRAEDTVFCGRVFMFLFQSFELGNKASVNLRGEFHTENVTVFDEAGDKDGATDEAMEVDGEASNDVLGDGKPVFAEGQGETDMAEVKATDAKEAEQETQKEKDETDIHTLYTSFWSLQRVFSNPTTLFSTEDFEDFKRGLDLTMKKFKSMPKVMQTQGVARTLGDGARGLKRKRNRDGDEFANNFNPKYLTSRDLFELEMSDLTFQRHILIQTLITLDFLLSLTSKAKVKLSTLKAQKAMTYPYILSEADTKWALDARAQTALYLQDGPDGKFYYRMADTVLARDKNWVRWKVESCPPISKAPVPTAEQMDALRGAKRQCAPRRIKAHPLGAIDMAFVSDTRNVNALDTLRDAQRCRVPGAEKWVEEVERLNLDLEMATPDEEDYMKEGRTTALWRALRVAGRTRFNVLDRVDEGEGLKILKGVALDGDGDGGGQTEGASEDKDGTDVRMDEAESETTKAEDRPQQTEDLEVTESQGQEVISNGLADDGAGEEDTAKEMKTEVDTNVQPEAAEAEATAIAVSNEAGTQAQEDSIVEDDIEVRQQTESEEVKETTMEEKVEVDAAAGVE